MAFLAYQEVQNPVLITHWEIPSASLGVELEPYRDRQITRAPIPETPENGRLVCLHPVVKVFNWFLKYRLQVNLFSFNHTQFIATAIS